jgi:6-pyruvoyltetrahydropterin/6-carboxytetrahydropterin synthase
LYDISIETKFAASHQLHGYNGPCKSLHGHTWKIRVEVTTTEVDEIGISFDFKALKSITEEVIDRFDHEHINSIPPFDKKNPTAEHLSRYIYDEIKERLPGHVKIARVTLWESDQYAISYSENPLA